MSGISEDFYALPTWQTLRVFGPDARSWLNGIVSCDLAKVAKGIGVWGSLLNKQGKICADLQVTGSAEELFVGLAGGDAGEVLSILDGLLVMEDAEIERSDRLWAVGAEATLRRGSGEKWDASRVQWGEEEVFILPLSGEDRAVISSTIPIEPLNSDEWAAWLVDHGVPRWGLDYSAADNLHAAGLDHRTVDWSKGCYLGQEVVCMQDMRGKVRRRLVKLKLESDARLSIGDQLENQESVVVGEVTSVGRASAIARVRAPEFESGSTLSSGETQVLVVDLC